MKAICNHTLTESHDDHKGDLALVYDDGQPILGLIGLRRNGSLGCLVIDGIRTYVRDAPSSIISLPEAQLEAVLPTATSDYRRTPMVGDLILVDQHYFIVASTGSNGMVCADVDSGEITICRQHGVVFSHWRIWHPSADKSQQLLYDSLTVDRSEDD
ncbi:hypothetical protein [Pelagibacterium lentulum]|uniref:Uncharacterized protein n=1 Tax=Pelagibacterium lentulum TaxID=2029865 RepID=A0A916R9A7_9HYPH|nr:hypothetical protein [Pelagibacterium lentulum]GGA47241.1 hypothetical protein GCM10011499_16270 [Pelagibacterium lentulum]